MEKFLNHFGGQEVDFKKEAIAGVTTFLAMAYIIAVNPSILSTTGMNAGALVTATCLTAGVITIFMGLYANLPFALASGMGLNAYFAFTVCGQKGISWEIALTAVFVEGIIFILLSLFKVREAVVKAIPLNLKYAVTVGIGLFIAFIGFIDAGVVAKDESTLVTIGKFATPTVAVASIGLILIVILERKRVKGAILWGILGATAVAWAYAAIYSAGAKFFNIALPNGIVKFESIAPVAGKLDFSYVFHPQNIVNFFVIVFTFLFVDFFDTLGTLVGVSAKAGMLDKDGNVPHAGRALLVDAIGTTAGAALGVSTVTTYVESATGVAEGGRTGFTSVITGLLFLAAMFFSPLFVAIPKCATAPALIYVGYLMMESIVKINFADVTEAVPAFLTIILMPLTYSIGDGLTVGVLSYVVINLILNLFSKEKKKISVVMFILALVFIFKLIIIPFL